MAKKCWSKEKILVYQFHPKFFTKNIFDKKIRTKKNFQFSLNSKSVHCPFGGDPENYGLFPQFQTFCFGWFPCVLIICFRKICIHNLFWIAHNWNNISHILQTNFKQKYFTSLFSQIDHLCTLLYLWSHVLHHFEITFMVYL